MAIKRRVKNSDFEGIDLNENTVQGIFKECLALDDSTENIRKCSCN